MDKVMKTNFKKSPLNELYFGLQYYVDGLTFVVQNEFFTMISDDFPNIEEKPPLLMTFDKMHIGMVNDPRNASFAPQKRYFFINSSNTKLIQMQEGKFLLNWRQLPEKEEEYPHFTNVFNDFKKYWDILYSILKKNNVSLELNQLELSYVNHIFLDEFEEGIAGALNCLGPMKTLNEVDSLSFNFSLIDNICNGHINLSLKSGTRNADKKPLFRLETIMRGFFSNECNDIDSWFNHAHNRIIDVFMQIVSEKAKNVWGLEP
jgi:uncharacterized protein (TIGR04255 family)